MGNTRLDTALNKVIRDTGLPDDEYENHRFMVNLKIPDKLNTSASSDFNLLLNDLYESTVGGRNNTAAAFIAMFSGRVWSSLGVDFLACTILPKNCLIASLRRFSPLAKSNGISGNATSAIGFFGKV